MKWVFIKNGMLIMVVSMISSLAYGLLFFNGTGSTIDFHARIDSNERNDALGVRAALDSKKSFIWQAPPAQKLKVTIALPHHRDMAVVTYHKKHTVHAKAVPAIPSFPPWQKTEIFTFDATQFSTIKGIHPSSSIIMKRVADGRLKVAVIPDSLVRLTGAKLYAKRLLNAKRGNRS